MNRKIIEKIIPFSNAVIGLVVYFAILTLPTVL